MNPSNPSIRQLATPLASTELGNTRTVNSTYRVPVNSTTSAITATRGLV